MNMPAMLLPCGAENWLRGKHDQYQRVRVKVRQFGRQSPGRT